MSLRTLVARYDGTCAACGKPVRSGDRIAYDSDTRAAYHDTCADLTAAPTERARGARSRHDTTTKEATP